MQGTLRFSDVFRGQRKVALGTNGLIIFNNYPTPFHINVPIFVRKCCRMLEIIQVNGNSDTNWVDGFRWGTHLYMSLFPSVRPSVSPSVHCTWSRPYLRNRTSSDHSFWYTYVKWWYLQAFFSLFLNFNFWAIRGVKEQKIAQNEK